MTGIVVYAFVSAAIMIAIAVLPIVADMIVRNWTAVIFGDDDEIRRTERVVVRCGRVLPNWYMGIAYRWARTAYPSLYRDYIGNDQYFRSLSKEFPKAGNKYQ